MAIDYGRLVDELTKLRHGRGLTLAALTEAPTVLEALGNVPVTIALERLIGLVRDLGEEEPALALRVAYGIDAAPGVLSHRRNDLHEAGGRDIKTLIRYENKMIDELATGLTFGAQRGTLLVAGWVQDRRLYQGRAELREPTRGVPPEVQETFKSTTDFPSLPLFIYKLPSVYTPERLILGVRFWGDQPTKIWAVNTPHLWEVSTLRYERRLLHGHEGDWFYVEYEPPHQDVYYGFGWTFDA